MDPGGKSYIRKKVKKKHCLKHWSTTTGIFVFENAVQWYILQSRSPLSETSFGISIDGFPCDSIIVGNVINCKNFKSRLTKENKKVDVLLRYDQGLNRYYGLLELAEKYDIIKKVSTRYEMPDGAKVFGKQIISDPEKYFTDDIMKSLNEAANKEFSYGGFDVESEETDGE